MKPKIESRMVKARRQAVGLSLAVISLLLPACSLPEIQQAQPDTTRYYVMGEPGAPIPEAGPSTPVLALREVRVPAYLMNRSMAVRQGENELKFIADARWAEPLESGITRLLGERLTARTRVMINPASAAPHDYDVRVKVLNCEGTASGGTGGIRFAAEIEVKSAGPDAAIVSSRTFAAQNVTWDGRDYAQLANLLSGAVVELADAVLAALPEKK
ncbi:MAG: ABC-type transport auxiliary lipoprotein family protein [Opitutaceae bacterium]|nr:ABC-type transport auxiliary lipoprotein family protein [Opitutaceae bacterium]